MRSILTKLTAKFAKFMSLHTLPLSFTASPMRPQSIRILPEDDRDGGGGDDGELGDDGSDEGGGRHIVHQVQQAQAFLRPPIF
jgi:hypothetical protein